MTPTAEKFIDKLIGSAEKRVKKLEEKIEKINVLYPSDVYGLKGYRMAEKYKEEIDDLKAWLYAQHNIIELTYKIEALETDNFMLKTQIMAVANIAAEYGDEAKAMRLREMAK